MTLICYNDTFGYGWKHVDLFTHDLEGNELNWVHWGVPEDGPEAADRVTARIEPSLERSRRREPLTCDEKAARCLGGDPHAEDASWWRPVPRW